MMNANEQTWPSFLNGDLQSNETETGKPNYIELIFQALKNEENRKADPDEQIRVENLTAESPEYSVFKHIGVTDEELNNNQLPRKTLLQAGYIFNNRPLPNMEKPLIATTIGGVDFSKRHFLTQQELDMVREYQRSHPEIYGSEEIQTDEFRKDMLSFLLTANNPLPENFKAKVSLLRNCVSWLRHPYLTPEDEDWYLADRKRGVEDAMYHYLVSCFIEQGVGSSYDSQNEFIARFLQNEMPWEEAGGSNRFTLKARGKQMMNVSSRSKKLTGFPSPFLDSGYHPSPLISNPDYTVLYEKEGVKKVFRVNTLVLHLASRGISEMGGEEDDYDVDQDFTIGNYERELYQRDTVQRQAIHQLENEKYALEHSDKHLQQKVIQTKLKKLALTWAESANAPIFIRRLALRIKRYSQVENPSRLRNIVEIAALRVLKMRHPYNAY